MANVTLRGHSLGTKAVIAKATTPEVPGDSERERKGKRDGERERLEKKKKRERLDQALSIAGLGYTHRWYKRLMHTLKFNGAETLTLPPQWKEHSAFLNPELSETMQ